MYNSYAAKGPRAPLGKRQENQNWQQYAPGYDYQSYYAAWQNYQNQQQYYGYDQNAYAAYGANYQYQQATPYAAYPSYPSTAPTAEETAPQEVPQVQAQPEQQSATTTTTTTTEQYYNSNSAYEAATESTLVEEHEIALNEDDRNIAIIRKNQELFDAIDDIRWLPLDGLNPPYLKPK